MSENSVRKKTLLEKYEIPVESLDFSYVETCTDVKTLEKIVKVLRSGEEGFYPDLTRCAEEKLRSLKPDSKVFRVEEPALKKENLDEGKRIQLDSEMKSWIEDMKKQDEIVKEIKHVSRPEVPIRKSKKSVEVTAQNSKPSQRIKSTDYQKWEQFDAEAAELKFDLDEERQREIVEVKNKKNLKLIEEIKDDSEVDCLTEFEKDHFALKFKEKGNECYKAKDYDEAIKEYTQSLRIKKSAAAFNNRALVYLKMKNYIKVISDSNECLKIEPMNIKALIRKAQAFVGQEMLHEACETFEKVIDIDNTNQIAHNALVDIRRKLPPRNSFRMKIEEINDVEPVKKQIATEKLEIADTNHIPKMVQNIVVEESTPFDKLMTKDKQHREKLIMPSDSQPRKRVSLIQEIH